MSSSARAQQETIHVDFDDDDEAAAPLLLQVTSEIAAAMADSYGTSPSALNPEESAAVDAHGCASARVAVDGDCESPTTLLVAASTTDLRPREVKQRQEAASEARQESVHAWYGDPRLRYCVAVVNRMSGERSAAEHVYGAVRALVGEHRVIDLTAAVFRDPTPLLDMVAAHAVPPADSDAAGAARGLVEFMRGTVLVSGGDGTVSFVMQIIDRLAGSGRERVREDGPGAPPTAAMLTPAVAVLALGTGNDLSNCLGFGLGYTKTKLCCCCVCCPNDLVAMANSAIAAPAVSLDRWEILFDTLNADGSVFSSRRVIANNYFSIGMDAFICKEFDAKRKQHPSCFRMRAMNKMWYGHLGLVGWWRCGRINDFVTLSVDGCPASLPPKSKALVVSNVDSYSGGGQLWKAPAATKSPSQQPAATLTGSGSGGGSGGAAVAIAAPPARNTPFSDVDATPVFINDGRFEVQSLGGLVDMSLLQLHVGGGAAKISQGSTCVIRVHCGDCAAAQSQPPRRTPIFAQVDGEPAGALTQPTRITITKHTTQGFVRCFRSSVVLPGITTAFR